MDRIDSFILLGYLTQLEFWAPTILAQGPKASKDDLKEIIRLRAIIDREVPVYAEAGDSAPFFAMLRADRACVPVSATLLYLSKEEADEVVQAQCLPPNPLSWYGIHHWESTETLPWWLKQAEAKSICLTPAEALQAMLSLWAEKGREWGNEAFVDADGSYRKSLGEDTLATLLDRALKNREEPLLALS